MPQEGASQNPAPEAQQASEGVMTEETDGYAPTPADTPPTVTPSPSLARATPAQPPTAARATSTPSAKAPSAKAPSAKAPSAKAPSAKAPSAKAPSAKAPNATGRPVVSSVRQRTGTAHPAQRPRYARRESWWRKNRTLLITVGAVVVLIGIFFGIAHNQASGPARQAASPQVFQQVTNVPASVFDQVGTGNLKNPIMPLPAAPLLTQSGKPEVLYIGAEYCPYCAAERWSVITALSRFGTWHNLNTTTSTSTDVFPNTNTFTFMDSGYTSNVLAFTPKEIQDRDGNALQSLTSQEQAIFSKYDAPPFVPQASTSGIPFISFGNQYMTVSSGYSPQLLQGLTWSQIAGKLSNPNDPVTQGIVGNANYLSATICKITNNTPGSVCNSQTIQQIVGQLPAHP
jgi:hypothetical protein